MTEAQIVMDLVWIVGGSILAFVLFRDAREMRKTRLRREERRKNGETYWWRD